MCRTLHFAAFVALFVASSSALADDEPVTLNVWPGKAPGAKETAEAEKYMPELPGVRKVQRLTNVSQPTIAVYRPAEDKNTGASVLICPGGGYRILAMDLEGEEVARWLNSIGVTGIVLKYRVPSTVKPAENLPPLQDAQRAMRVVRANAEKWNLDPARLGVLGFSAGGHLAARTATHFDQQHYEPLDASDDLSCRPDFAVLIYPAYLDKDGELVEEIRVSKETPPAFVVHAYDDPLKPESSLVLFQALKKADVPAELHIYGSGGHGFGLRPSEHSCCTWPQRCEEWLNSRSVLGKASAE
ncbi:MAG TPA: alpha/beta hydrolase [Pirellulales bacterium]|nr:alpha/beta hydrolase [Pirellulales bacterium]